MPDLNQLINLSPLVLLLVSISILLWSLKSAVPSFPKWALPTVSFIMGTALFPLISTPGKVPYEFTGPFFNQLLVGFLIGGSAYGTYQQIIKVLQRWGFFLDEPKVEVIAVMDLKHDEDNERNM